jgi:hypothetical protein
MDRRRRHAASSPQQAFKGSEIPIDPGVPLQEEGAQSGPDPETTAASSGQLERNAVSHQSTAIKLNHGFVVQAVAGSNPVVHPKDLQISTF